MKKNTWNYSSSQFRCFQKKSCLCSTYCKDSQIVGNVSMLSFHKKLLWGFWFWTRFNGVSSDRYFMGNISSILLLVEWLNLIWCSVRFLIQVAEINWLVEAREDLLKGHQAHRTNRRLENGKLVNRNQKATRVEKSQEQTHSHCFITGWADPGATSILPWPLSLHYSWNTEYHDNALD